MSRSHFAKIGAKKPLLRPVISNFQQRFLSGFVGNDGEFRVIEMPRIVRSKKVYKLMQIYPWHSDNYSVKYIGNRAFEKCTALEKIIISSSVKEMGYEVFKNAGAISIRVEASREIRSQRGELVGESDITEVGLDHITDWNYIIENNSVHVYL